MTQPNSREEYLARFAKNQQITGYGAQVKTHFPCPFCAAADWMIQPITDGDYRVMQTVHTCAECKRSGKFQVVRVNGDISAEFVQTGGDDPPPWLDPPPRRV